jgi:plastocyanin
MQTQLGNVKSWLELSAVLLLCSALAWGCGRERQPAPVVEAERSVETAAAPKADTAAALEGVGTISGKVIYKGALQPVSVPITRDQEVCGKEKMDPSMVISSQGGVQNAVVYIKDIRNGQTLEPKKVTLDQKGCEYRPHVLAFPAGSTVEILNPDGILHNVHSQSTVNSPFNLAQPKFKPTMEVKIEKPEIISVKCDVHPWMSGWFFVAENPYYSLTDNNGGFSLADVPPGKYVVQLWHEKLGTQTKEVQIEPNGKLELNFELAGPVS